MFVYRVDETISLRLIEDQDADDLFTLVQANREHLRQGVRWVEHIHSLRDMRTAIQRARKRLATDRGWEAVIRVQGQTVGMIRLSRREPLDEIGEIGYWLARPFTGRGIMTRSVAAMTSFGFATLGLQKIIICCEPENHRSAGIPRRLGFRVEGMKRHESLSSGRPVDLDVYAAYTDDWSHPPRKPAFAFPVDRCTQLRLLEQRHTADYHKLVNSSRAYLGRWENWVDTTQNYRDALSFVQTFLRRYADDQGYSVGIWTRPQAEADFQMAGNIGCFADFGGVVELGYWLAEHFTGSGLMTRSLKALIRHLFLVEKRQRILIRAAAQNTRSRALAERLGFHLDTVRANDHWLRGEFVDQAYYSLYAADWKES